MILLRIICGTRRGRKAAASDWTDPTDRFRLTQPACHGLEVAHGRFVVDVLPRIEDRAGNPSEEGLAESTNQRIDESLLLGRNVDLVTLGLVRA
jgi:hypothetical protein